MFLKLAVICCTLAVALGASLDPRIVGGHDAAKGEFPYQVSVQYGYSFFHTHVCGGSVISDRWILTAGHCVTEVPHIPFAGYFIKAGIYSLKDKGQVIKVAGTFVHPKYLGKVNPNDIALMKLQSSLVFGEGVVEPIKMPQKDSIPTGTSTLSGWGSTGGNPLFPKMPSNLQTDDMPLISYEDCAKAFVKISGTSEPLADTNICTGPLTGGVSACSGDSGGPLVTRDQNGVQQVGIVSWGMSPCGSKGVPSVYTRVSAFVDFITDTMAKN